MEMTGGFSASKGPEIPIYRVLIVGERVCRGGRIKPLPLLSFSLPFRVLLHTARPILSVSSLFFNLRNRRRFGTYPVLQQEINDIKRE
jgi:hypothetical protein